MIVSVVPMMNSCNSLNALFPRPQGMSGLPCRTRSRIALAITANIPFVVTHPAVVPDLAAQVLMTSNCLRECSPALSAALSGEGDPGPPREEQHRGVGEEDTRGGVPADRRPPFLSWSQVARRHDQMKKSEFLMPKHLRASATLTSAMLV